MATVSYTVINGEIVAENRGGTERDYVPDPLGSTVALLDNSQTKTDTFSYWPYGEVRTRTGSSPTTAKYLGTLGYYATQSPASFQYVRARFYDTSRCRWLTVDPYPVNRASTTYPYCFDNPEQFVDPSGLIPRFPFPKNFNSFRWWCNKNRRWIIPVVEAIGSVIQEPKGTEIGDLLDCVSQPREITPDLIEHIKDLDRPKRCGALRRGPRTIGRPRRGITPVTRGRIGGFRGGFFRGGGMYYGDLNERIDSLENLGIPITDWAQSVEDWWAQTGDLLKNEGLLP
jgi:RHS repeat-associated protein